MAGCNAFGGASVAAAVAESLAATPSVAATEGVAAWRKTRNNAAESEAMRKAKEAKGLPTVPTSIV